MLDLQRLWCSIRSENLACLVQGDDLVAEVIVVVIDVLIHSARRMGCILKWATGIKELLKTPLAGSSLLLEFLVVSCGSASTRV